MSLILNILLFLVLFGIAIYLFFRLKSQKDRINISLAFIIGLILLIIANWIIPKKQLMPDLDAKVLVSDLKNDSLFVNFQLINNGDGLARDIWYIAKLNENIDIVSSEKIKELGPHDEIMLNSAIGSKMDKNQEIIYPLLWVGYNMKSGRREKIYYKRFEFVITNVNTNRESNSPSNSFPPNEIDSPETLINQIVNFSERLSLKSGSLYMVFELKNAQSLFKIIESSKKDKLIWYNPIDSTVDFFRIFNNGTAINLTGKIDMNKSSSSHLLVVIWSDTSSHMEIDNQRVIYKPYTIILNKENQKLLLKGLLN